MGLDTTHDCWHGSYGAFSRWREQLAIAAGYTFSYQPFTLGIGPEPTVEEVERGGVPMRLSVQIDWGNIERAIGTDLQGKWDSIPVRPDGTPDPLIILIAHSDCEGFIQAKFCGPLADRLEELLPKLEGIDAGGHVGLMTEKTQTFIKGLRKAAKRKQKVGFH